MELKIYNSSAFEEQLKRTMKELRGRLEEASQDRFHLEIHVSGEVMHGDLKVEYQLSESRYDPATKGGRLQAVFDEHVRRHGWNAVNAPLCLPRVDDSDVRKIEPPTDVLEQPAAPDEKSDIPF